MKCKYCDKKIRIHWLFKGKKYCTSLCEFKNRFNKYKNETSKEESNGGN